MEEKAWAKRYTKCRYCKRSDSPHKCRGLCSYCYLYIWQYVRGRNKHKTDALAKDFRKVFYDHIVG